MKQRSFPAVVIAFLLLLGCYFPGQRLLAYCFPGLAGRATLDAGLTIIDIPIRLPFAVDLILVPGLFIILYSVAVLVLSSGVGRWAIMGNRLRAVAISVLLLLFCVAIGSIISWLVCDHLPAQVRNSITSFAVNTNLHLPYAGYAAIPFRGDVFSFLGLAVAFIFCIRIMGKAPRIRIRSRLTREQRMTPYQRMLLERRYGTPRQPAADNVAILPTIPRHQSTSIMPRCYDPSDGICRNEPLLSLEPEAVNFRPLG